MSKLGQKVSVIIPAYNEAANIGRVLEKIGREYEIIVVDDGSSDETPDVARKHGAKVISYRENRGKGYALKRGIAESRGNILVFLDGDGQHNPVEIPKLAAPIIAGKVDIVIGARSSKIRGRGPIRRLTNRISVLVVWFICGRKYCDVLSGFRAVNRSVFSKIALSEDGFQTELELLIKSSRGKLRILDVPITAEETNRPSKLSVGAGIKIVFYLCNEILRKMKK